MLQQLIIYDGILWHYCNSPHLQKNVHLSDKLHLELNATSQNL